MTSRDRRLSGSPTKLSTGAAPAHPHERKSPRSSIDSPSATTTGSPFLHNLQQRLKTRKSSNASSQTSDSQHDGGAKATASRAAGPPGEKPRAEASRAAKRYLLSVIRDDWEYPSKVPKASHVPRREPLSYRLREDGLSDAEVDRSPHGKRRSSSNPYRFENPDAVAQVVHERRIKRRRILEDQMTWNTGLRHWTLQRDAWTGAVERKPDTTRHSRHHRAESQLKDKLHERNTSNSTASTTDSSASASANDSAHNVDDNPGKVEWPCDEEHSLDGSNSTVESDPTAVDPQAPPPPPGSTFSPVRSHSQSDGTNVPQKASTSAPRAPSAVSAHADDPEAEIGPWLPIFPPLFDNENELRSRVQPAAYPTIYSKVVVQCLNPSVPIPLTHMTAALVEGWKTEGNWPPAPTAPLAADNKKGRASGAFARWRRDKSAKGGGGLGKSGELVGGDGKRRSISDKVRSVFRGEKVEESGLADVGIEFEEQDTEEMEGNVTLNKGLLEQL